MSRQSSDSNTWPTVTWTVPERFALKLKDREKIEAQIDQWVKEVMHGWNELEKSIANINQRTKFDRTGHYSRSRDLGQGPAFGRQYTDLYTRYDEATQKLIAFALPKPEYAGYPGLFEAVCRYSFSRGGCGDGPDDASGDPTEDGAERPQPDGGTD